MSLTKITTDSIDLSSNTNGLKIPKGTTAQRPAAVDSTVGELRENTTTGKMEIYIGTTVGWRALQQTGQDVGIVPSNNFNTVLYTGNGTTKSITGLNFQPDLTWVKDRDVAHDNLLVDSVNGAGSVKGLVSNTTYAEGAYTATDGYISSLNSNGFTVSTGSSSANYTNVNTNDYVSWSWKAGGTAVQNNDGTITGANCMVSANPDAGFSIIKWIGDGTSSGSIGHDLGKAPELVILKNSDTIDSWYTYAEGVTGNNQYLKLNTTDAVFTAASDSWGAGPTSSVMGLRPQTFSSSGNSLITYCWTSIPNYSLISTYTGTNSTTNTPKIYTGFQPGFIMVKRTDSTGDWNIVDNKRSTSNPRNIELFANQNYVEAIANYINFNADGFQIITNDTDWNAAGGKYLFMCFAS